MRTFVLLSEAMPFGGTTNFALNLCCGFAKYSQNWRGIAASLKRADYPREFARQNGFEFIEPTDSNLLHEDRLGHVYKTCSTGNVPVVIAGLSSGSFELLRLAPKGVLRVAMIQSDDMGVYELVKSYLEWIDVVVGVSDLIARKAQTMFQKEGLMISCQPYGVPMPGLDPAKSIDGVARVLYLGRVIEDQKRVSILFETMRKSLGTSISVEWTIAGDGPELPRFKAEFEGDPRVHILGEVAYQDIPRIIQEHHVYFLCSGFEGLPLAMLESMGGGLVPVVSDLPSGIRQVVNENNGCLVPIDNHDLYFEKLLLLVSDKEAFVKKSALARKTVADDYSIPAMVQRWETLLNERCFVNNVGWEKNKAIPRPLLSGKRFASHRLLLPVRRLIKKFCDY